MSIGSTALWVAFFAVTLEMHAMDLTEWYEARTYTAAEGRYKDTPLPYRLMKPAATSTNELRPLVVFLHGAGERASDNLAQLAFLPEWMVESNRLERFPCFLVAPQCPTNRVWGSKHWTEQDTTMSEQPGDEMSALIAIIETLIASEAIDPRRVYLTGLSMGGYGTWDLAMRRPDLFAAVVPICGGGDTTRAAALAHLPVWAWHGDRDTVVSVERSRAMIAAIRAAGGSPKYTELPGVNHDSWSPAYTSAELIPWMFEQRRP